MLLDRSASMAVGTRWAEATSAAEELLRGLSPDDHASLVLFDEVAEVVSPSSREHAETIRLLGEVSPRDRRSSVASGIRAVRPTIADHLADPGFSRTPEVVIVSDFTLSAAADLDDATRLPPGTELALVPTTNQRGAENRSVRSVEILRGGGEEGGTASRREQVTVAAILGSDSTSDEVADGSGGGEASESVEVSLLLDGRVVETQSVSLSGRSTQLAFRPVALEAGRATSGEVRLEQDFFPADDSFFFTASASDSLAVLVVDRSRRTSGLYVERALRTLKTPRFRVERNRGELSIVDLSGIKAAIVLDAGSLSSGEVDILESYVRDGGGLLVSYGRDAISRGLPAWLDLRETSDVLQSRAGVRIASVNQDHPATAKLSGGDWGAAQFFRHFALKAVARPGEASLEVLARFDTGDVAAVSTEFGLGRIIALGSTLDTGWNELPRHALFLGWLDQSLQHLGQFVPRSDAYVVGQPVLVETAGASGEDWVLTGPDGSATGLNRGPQEGSEAGPLLVAFEASGHSSLRLRGADADSALVHAANLDRRESSLEAADMAVVEAQLRPSADAPSIAASSQRAVPRTSFWWLVLYGALLLLISEGVVASRRRATAAAY